MPPILPSKRLNRLYHSLPPEAQRTLVESHLSTLLDSLPPAKAKKIISAATRSRDTYSPIPSLDLRGKKREITALLNAHAREIKYSFIKDRSDPNEVLAEIIDSLVFWLKDIWSVVYEHNVHFAEAHQCLLYATEVLDQIAESSGPGGCKCATRGWAISLSIKDKTGKLVKKFSFSGPLNIERVLLWIWRDLFVSMSASGGPRGRKDIPAMLVDIEEVLGWEALERLLYGGHDSSTDEDADEDNWEDYTDGFDGDEDDEEAEDEADDPEDDSRCPCNFHARHWSDKVNRHRIYLRELVQERLQSVFQTAPSLSLYQCITAITSDIPETRTQLSTILSDVASSSSDTLAAALEIHASENNAPAILKLLDAHAYLLRARDARSLQDATLALGGTSQHHPRALEILEKELLDTVHAIRAAVQSSFCRVDEPRHRDEVTRIMKLTMGSQQRADAIERWVEGVATPSSGALHPVALAAMMMGFPTPGIEEGDDGEVFAFLDMHHADPDLEDLREEFRPELKKRFDTWIETAGSIKGGGAILVKVYVKMVEVMPFLRAIDIVEEMLNRMNDRPSREHVVEALGTLQTFGKVQRKKLLQRNEKKKRSEKQPGSQTGSSSSGNSSFRAGSNSNSNGNGNGFAFSFQSSLPQFGGIDDVD